MDRKRRREGKVAMAATEGALERRRRKWQRHNRSGTKQNVPQGCFESGALLADGARAVRETAGVGGVLDCGVKKGARIQKAETKTNRATGRKARRKAQKGRYTAETRQKKGGDGGQTRRWGKKITFIALFPERWPSEWEKWE
jgi:hypothetical protein